MIIATGRHLPQPGRGRAGRVSRHGRLLRGDAGGGAALPGPARARHRRGQFGRAGGDVPEQVQPAGESHRARRQPAQEHVAATSPSAWRSTHASASACTPNCAPSRAATAWKQFDLENTATGEHTDRGERRRVHFHRRHALHGFPGGGYPARRKRLRAGRGAGRARPARGRSSVRPARWKPPARASSSPAIAARARPSAWHSPWATGRWPSRACTTCSAPTPEGRFVVNKFAGELRFEGSA